MTIAAVHGFGNVASFDFPASAIREHTVWRRSWNLHSTPAVLHTDAQADLTLVTGRAGSSGFNRLQCGNRNHSRGQDSGDAGVDDCYHSLYFRGKGRVLRVEKGVFRKRGDVLESPLLQTKGIGVFVSAFE
jgi:hypothetical protein